MEKRPPGQTGNERLKAPIPTLFVSPDIEKMFTAGYSSLDFIKDISPSGTPKVLFTRVERGPHKSKYVRDFFQQFGDTTFLAPHAPLDKVNQILGMELKMSNILESPLGIGGNVLRSGKLVVLPESHRNLEGVNLLVEKGCEVDFLPIPFDDEKTLLSMRMGMNHHLDTEINFVQNGDKYLFLVNNDYYERFRNEVDSLAARHNGEVDLIKSVHEQTALRGVNFLELPDGRVALPYNCWAARLALESKLGQERVVPINIDFSKTTGIAQTFVNEVFTTLYFHGGLRCLTNVLN